MGHDLKACKWETEGYMKVGRKQTVESECEKKSTDTLQIILKTSSIQARGKEQ